MVTIAAVYENGVFRPLEPVTLEEGERVEVLVGALSSERMSPSERARYLAALDEIDALPDEQPGDVFSNRDHDRVLYGEPRR